MKKSKFVYVVIASFLGLFILRELGLLSSEVLTWPILLVAVIGLVYFIMVNEEICMKNKLQQKICLDNLDFMRYVCAIFIILIHLRPFAGDMDRLDVFFNNIIGRICVPLYFFITGYFVAKKSKDQPDYVKQYIKGMIPLYIGWSILYLPFAFLWLKDTVPFAIEFVESFGFDSTINLLIYIVAIPIALAVAFLYIGTYYHLWYFPALFFSLWIVDKARKKMHIKWTMVITLALLIVGASETYYGMLPNEITHYLDFYFKVFITTRNFLFFGLFYVALGSFIGTKKQWKVNYCVFKLGICIFLLFIEAYFLQATNRLNSNIMLSCIPLVYYLFFTLLYMNKIWTISMKYSFRDYYKYYYLIHPMMIVFVQIFLYDQLFILTNYVRFLDLLLVLILTHLGSVWMIRMKLRYPKCIL